MRMIARPTRYRPPTADPIIWAMGDQWEAEGVRPLWTVSDSSLRVAAAWMQGPGTWEWMFPGGEGTGYLDPTNTRVSDMVAAGKTTQGIIWLADAEAGNPGYSTGSTFLDTDLPRFVRILRGNGPNYGDVYLVVYTEAQTMSPAVSQSALVTAYLTAVRNARATYDRCYVGMGMQGTSLASGSADLSVYAPAFAVSDFLAVQHMHRGYYTDGTLGNLMLPQLTNAHTQLATYGLPVMIAHSAIWGEGTAQQQIDEYRAGWQVLADWLTDTNLGTLRGQHVFLWSWMDRPFINDTAFGGFHQAVARLRRWRASSPAWPPSSAPTALSANQAGIETDASGWTADWYNATIARTTTQARSGVASLQVTAQATQTGMGVQTTKVTTDGQGNAVAAGQQWMGWFRARAAATGRPIGAALRYWTSGDVWIADRRLTDTSGAPLVSDTTSGWVRCFVQGTTPANTAKITLAVEVPGSVVAGEVHYVDDAVLIRDVP